MLERIYQLSNLLDNLDKIDKFEFRWLIAPLNSNEESREEKNKLNQGTSRLMSIDKVLVGYGMKHYYSKAKLFEDIQIYLQAFVRVVVYKNRKVGQSVLYALEKYQFLG